MPVGSETCGDGAPLKTGGVYGAIPLITLKIAKGPAMERNREKAGWSAKG